MSTLTQDELKVITDAARNYFGRLTKEAARVSASFLVEAGDLPEFDYTGLITISGAYRGWVYFTAPKMMMRFLLLSVGETMQGDDIFMDAAGEIANTIAGNARKHFGDKMEISVPHHHEGHHSRRPHPHRQQPGAARVADGDPHPVADPGGGTGGGPGKRGRLKRRATGLTLA